MNILSGLMNSNGKINKQKLINVLTNNAILIFLFLLVIYTSVTRDNFFSGNNFSNIAANVSVRFIMALGVSGCLITRGTDLSAGRMAGLSGVVAATMLQRADYTDKFLFWESWTTNAMTDNLGLKVLVVALIVVVVCALIGLINGLIISYLHVPPFLATLGMQTIVYGLNQVYSASKPIGGLVREYTNVTTGYFFEIFKFRFSYLFIIAIIVGALMWFLYNMTRHGKYMYAIGGNEVAAEVSGVNVKVTLIKIYFLAGALYGLGGFLLGGKAGGASVNLGTGYELEAIAACTIGGVSTSGGIGKVTGILLGVLVYELLKASMQFLGIDPSWQFVAQGVVIIVAVALDIRKYTRKK